MPLYEYVCHACGHNFELLRRMNEADRELKCPDCHSDEVERLFSAFSSGTCGSSSRFR